MRHPEMSDGILLDPTLQEPPRPVEGRKRRRSELLQPSRQGQTPRAVTIVDRSSDILANLDIAVERAQAWTGFARFGFNAMLASADYKNKLRLKQDKLDRIVYFLAHPEAKSRERDRADAQAKHQARQWTLQGGVLYRKGPQRDQLRRHVPSYEVFDILTAEHIQSVHLGRDKMLKLLEVKYIGYTKDELMYVLEHCLVCSGKCIRGAAAKRRQQKQDNASHPGTTNI
jgi:hypothetical protein